MNRRATTTASSGGQVYSLGHLVMKARRLKRMRQAQLAEFVGITVGALSRIERGHVTPRDGTIALLSEVLDLPYDALLKQAQLRRARERAMRPEATKPVRPKPNAKRVRPKPNAKRAR